MKKVLALSLLLIGSSFADGIEKNWQKGMRSKGERHELRQRPQRPDGPPQEGRDFPVFAEMENRRNLKSWLSELNEADREKAMQIADYLHASQQTLHVYMEDKQFAQAEELLKKRLRLVVPDAILENAPEMIKSFKAGTQMQLGNILIQSDRVEEGIGYLEKALQEAEAKDWSFLANKIRQELIGAYKKNGNDEKARGLLESRLKKAEQGLRFE
jgi:tetratricopeptide (TPR) repeat protein